MRFTFDEVKLKLTNLYKPQSLIMTVMHDLTCISHQWIPGFTYQIDLIFKPNSTFTVAYYFPNRNSCYKQTLCYYKHLAVLTDPKPASLSWFLKVYLQCSLIRVLVGDCPCPLHLFIRRVTAGGRSICFKDAPWWSTKSN